MLLHPIQFHSSLSALYCSVGAFYHVLSSFLLLLPEQISYVDFVTDSPKATEQSCNIFARLSIVDMLKILLERRCVPNLGSPKQILKLLPPAAVEVDLLVDKDFPRQQMLGFASGDGYFP